MVRRTCTPSHTPAERAHARKERRLPHEERTWFRSARNRPNSSMASNRAFPPESSREICPRIQVIHCQSSITRTPPVEAGGGGGSLSSPFREGFVGWRCGGRVAFLASPFGILRFGRVAPPLERVGFVASLDALLFLHESPSSFWSSSSSVSSVLLRPTPKPLSSSASPPAFVLWCRRSAIPLVHAWRRVAISS